MISLDKIVKPLEGKKEKNRILLFVILDILSILIFILGFIVSAKVQNRLILFLVYFLVVISFFFMFLSGILKESIKTNKESFMESLKFFNIKKQTSILYGLIMFSTIVRCIFEVIRLRSVVCGLLLLILVPVSVIAFLIYITPKRDGYFIENPLFEKIGLFFQNKIEQNSPPKMEQDKKYNLTTNVMISIAIMLCFSVTLIFLVAFSIY